MHLMFDLLGLLGPMISELTCDLGLEVGSCIIPTLTALFVGLLHASGMATAVYLNCLLYLS